MRENEDSCASGWAALPALHRYGFRAGLCGKSKLLVQGLVYGFKVWSLGFGVWGVGVSGLSFRFRVLGLGFRV
jgi:hypothetical protein